MQSGYGRLISCIRFTSFYNVPSQKNNGATATNGRSLIPVQEKVDGSVANWLEKVTEEQYNDGQ